MQGFQVHSSLMGSIWTPLPPTWALLSTAALILQAPPAAAAHLPPFKTLLSLLPTRSLLSEPYSTLPDATISSGGYGIDSLEPGYGGTGPPPPPEPPVAEPPASQEPAFEGVLAITIVCLEGSTKPLAGCPAARLFHASVAIAHLSADAIGT